MKRLRFAWNSMLVFALVASIAAAQNPAPSESRKEQRPSDPFATKDPPRNPTTPAKVALGKELFESTLLSRNRQISCATCHDPDRSFADGRAQSKGVFHVDVGRNSPSLIVAAMIPGFPGAAPKPRPAGQAPREGDQEAKLLDLEGRCLAPIENPVEMGSTVEEAVATLRAAPGMKENFDRAFGLKGAGVTTERLGQALAAFLRSVRPADAPYKKFVKGDLDAMKDEELRGLAIFKGRGRCDACHTGVAFTDGLFHDVMSPSGFRSRKELEKNAQLRREIEEARQRPAPPAKTGGTTSKLAPQPPRPDVATGSPGSQGSNSYIPVQTGVTGVQTLSLWDVQRTGPYFRDGLVEDLESAVRQHIAEIREVSLEITGAQQRAAASSMANCSPFLLTVENRTDIPRALKPKVQKDIAAPLPADLRDQEITDLLAFLRALSPRS